MRAPPARGRAAPGSASPRRGTGPCRSPRARARRARSRSRRRRAGPSAGARPPSITSATQAAKPAIAVRVRFTLRRNGSVSPPARRRVRWGRIEVWIAWKSWSGARAISSTLKVKPASAAPPPSAVAFTSSGPAFRNVCSQSMIRSTAAAKPAPRARVNSGSRAAGSSRAAASRLAGSGSGASAGSGSGGPRRRAARRQPARQRRRHHRQRDDRGGRHSERDRGLALGDPDRHGEREQAARAGLHQHQPAVERELVVARQVAAREVARGVREHAHQQHPVERRGAAEEVVLDRVAQHERHHREQDTQRELDRRRDAQVLAAVDAARVAVRDRPRQQLLHRPVEHRHRDEHRGPQQRDVAVLVLRERVAREREVGEGDEAGGAYPHRQDRRAAAVRARARAGQAAWSRGRASGPPRPCRSGRAVRRTPAWTSGSRGPACCRDRASRRRAPC